MLGCLRGKIFQKGSGYRGKKVDVCRRVETAREIGGDNLEVLSSRFDKVDYRDIGDGMAGGVDVAAAKYQSKP